MMQESLFHKIRGARGDFWWAAIPGLILLILNAGFYFQFPLEQFLGWGALDGTGFFSVWFSYLLLCFFGFFFIGLLRGRATWTARAAILLCVRVGLIGILPVMVVSVIVGLALMVGGNLLGGDLYLADATSLAPWIGGSEILAGIGGALLGRLIGSRAQTTTPRLSHPVGGCL